MYTTSVEYLSRGGRTPPQWNIFPGLPFSSMPHFSTLFFLSGGRVPLCCMVSHSSQSSIFTMVFLLVGGFVCGGGQEGRKGGGGYHTFIRLFLRCVLFYVLDTRCQIRLQTSDFIHIAGMHLLLLPCLWVFHAGMQPIQYAPPSACRPRLPIPFKAEPCLCSSPPRTTLSAANRHNAVYNAQKNLHPGHAERSLSNTTRILRGAAIVTVGVVMGNISPCRAPVLLPNPSPCGVPSGLMVWRPMETPNERRIHGLSLARRTVAHFSTGGPRCQCGGEYNRRNC